MKKIPVSALRVGLTFTEPVYIEENSLLVPAGIAVRKKDLDQLKSWGIEEVETEGEPAAAPAVKKPERKTAPVPAEVHENKGAYRSYMDLIGRLDLVFAGISPGNAVDVHSIDTITERLLLAVREQRDEIVRFILGGEVSGHELSKSSVNTAILSALTAAELKLPHHRILQIVTAALLHDAGMLRVPKEILEKKGGLSDKELRHVQGHPVYSYRIITKELLYPEDVGAPALHHHERWDGTGYPQHLAGAAIETGARIISVADAFEAMVSEKPYRDSLIGYQAMKNLLSDTSQRFDPDVLKAFVQTMGVYPIGSIVQLNNGAVARVIEVRGNAPMRPKIRVLINETGRAFQKNEGAVIDLSAGKGLFISRAVDPREFTGKRE